MRLANLETAQADKSSQDYVKIGESTSMTTNISQTSECVTETTVPQE